ncbi:hypothetical protein M6D93_04700 [Jatrophihabitans telluris]|uniref:ABC transporter permease n=1 Tax=Jatrophihabitans telluris TaxID=2038343 RepID=A0ABY4R075_9ACTN|nr:hypothetical protein [Jatrophihabitans telluris]UQX89306.1 hypothetical protein M6D93_04700 [Jatrophihabitans telluris]
MGIAMRDKVFFWIETVSSVLFALLFALTLVSREWIEALFGVDPDHGSGSLEWAIVAALGMAALASGRLAWSRWRRLSSRPAH